MSPYSNQKGATLVVALIILLVMTMVGVSSMRGTTLQERMASNSRQYQLSKNAAELALRDAETWLTNNVTSSANFAQFTNNTVGLYSNILLTGTTQVNPLANTVDVRDDNAWAALGREVTGLSSTSTSRNPRYIIEYIGRGVHPAYSTGNKIKKLGEEAEENPDPYFFRITAIGWGRDTNIYTVLESTYRTGTGMSFTY